MGHWDAENSMQEMVEEKMPQMEVTGRMVGGRQVEAGIWVYVQTSEFHTYLHRLF